MNVAPEEKLVFHYSEGIQSLHQPTYENYYLTCHPEAQPRELSARIASYEEVRKKGKVTFSPDGVEVIKLGALGRGAFFRVRDVRNEGERLEFKTLLRPDYLSINFTEFPPRAILFIMGEPLGRVIHFSPGKIPGPERSILKSVDLAWRWKKLPKGAPVGWCLESMEPISGSAVFRKLRFRETPPQAETVPP